MARRRRQFVIFSLSFLDVMSCGFGAVVLFFMIINHASEVRTQELNKNILAEVRWIDEDVLIGRENLVQLRNSMQRTEKDLVITEGLATRVITDMVEIRRQIASMSEDTTVREETIEALKAELQQKEEERRRLQGSIAEQDDLGDDIRTFIGQGDRQYVTGLKMGGKRILILVDASASMLDETIINVIIRRNLADHEKINSDKWQRAVRTVDWITARMPQESQFQIYTFNTSATPVVDDTDRKWLDIGDGTALNEAVEALKTVVPGGGTSLHAAYGVVGRLSPRPDNIYLIVDGLPTQGKDPPRKKTVSGRERLRHFDKALDVLPAGIPVNIIMLPMEGDPRAASEFWKLAMATEGSFMAPAKDWP